jgi:hypothetical protein
MISTASQAITAILNDKRPDAERTAASSVGRAAGTPPTGRWFFKMPDMSNEIFRAINDASACGTFMAICQAAHDQERRGRTEAVRVAAAGGQIGIGLRELARITGSSVVTIRKHCQALHQIGVIVQHRRGCQHVADPATGRIVTKNQGRTPTTLIYLTIMNDHLRPAAAKAAAERKRRGTEIDPPPVTSKDNFFTPSIESSTELGENTATHPVNVEAGRHPPAKTGQDRVTIVNVNPDSQGILVDDGTHNPASGTASRPQTPTGEERPTVANVTLPAQQTATASPAACGDHSLTDMGVADGSGLEPSAGSWLDEYRRLAGKGKPDPVLAEAELREAAAGLTHDQRRRAADAVREDAAVEAVAKRRLEAERQQRKLEKKWQQEAVKADAKAAYHRDRSVSAA